MSLLPATGRAADLAVRDLDRILSLARRPVVNCERLPGTRLYAPAAQALAEHVTERYARSRACKCRDMGRDCIKMLLPEQAWALREAAQVGGLHGALSVGSGKTVISLLLPLAIPCRLAVLLAKPKQRLHYEEHWKLLHEHFFVPSLVFDDGREGFVLARGSAEYKEFEARFGRPPPTVHFFPYSQLSRPESTTWLEFRAPDLIVADESHVIASNSVRTNRVKRYLATRPDDKPVALCDYSGTIVKKSVFDTAYLTTFGLGADSPLPLDPDEAAAWSLVVDPQRGGADTTSSTALALRRAFAPETGEGGYYPVDAVRNGIRRRMFETRGVVSTRAHTIDCSLYLHEFPVSPLPVAVQEWLKVVRKEKKRPDGEELAHAPEVARCVREVACGFYNHWVFRKEDPRERIREWFDKRQAYNRELRRKLEEAEPHLDSPMLCYNAASRYWQDLPYEGPLPTWASATWPEWSAIKDEVWHDSRYQWILDEATGEVVGDFLARDAAEWAREHRGLVWVQSRALGLRIAELAEVPYLAGGPHSEREVRAEKGDRSVVVSLQAHGESTDGFQRLFAEQLVVEPPASGNGWEQLWGRLARQQQKADEIHTWVALHCAEFRDDLRQALKLAQFIEATTPNRQWLAMADFTFRL